MGSRTKVRPTPSPSGPALVRPAVGALLLTLGCAPRNQAPMPPPPEPPMAPPGDDVLSTEPMVPPVEEPGDVPPVDPPVEEPSDAESP